MMQLSSSGNQLLNQKANNSFAQTYQVAPWLIRPLYPLGRYLVLPTYFGKIQVRGRENIPHTGPVILAPTHRSRWDALIIPFATGWLVTRRDLRFMVTSSEMTGFQGWLIQRLGGFPVDIQRPGISSVRHSVELLANQEMLVIFPEGGIFQDNSVHPLKEGIARIALQAQSAQNYDIKVVPISINYSQPCPSWDTDVFVDIGSPLNVANYNGDSSKQSAKRLTRDLEATLTELHQDCVSTKGTENFIVDCN